MSFTDRSYKFKVQIEDRRYERLDSDSKLQNNPKLRRSMNSIVIRNSFTVQQLEENPKPKIEEAS